MTLTTEIDPFDAPEQVEAGGGGGDNPTLRQLAKGCPITARTVTYRGEEHKVKTKGRLLLFWVTAKGKDVSNPEKPKDRLTVDVVFLDGEDIDGKYDKFDEVKVEYDVPLTAPSNVLTGSWISNYVLVKQLQSALGTGRPRLGRLGKLAPFKPGDDGPYVLLDPTDAEKQLAIKYINAMPVLDDPLADDDDDE